MNDNRIAWRNFNKGVWCDDVNVSNFIKMNYTAYDGDSSFLEGPTARTKKEMDRHSASVYEGLFRQAAEFGRQYETPAGRREEKKDQGTPAGGKVSAAADGQVCHAANRQSCPAAETVLSPEQRKMILAFVSMRKMNRAQKTATILKYGFTFNRLHRTAGECLFM